MSKHATDRLALLVGLPLLLLGIGDLADTAGLMSAGPWLIIPALVLAGLAGITSSLLSIRSGREQPPDPDQH